MKVVFQSPTIPGEQVGDRYFCWRDMSNIKNTKNKLKIISKVLIQMIILLIASGHRPATLNLTAADEIPYTKGKIQCEAYLIWSTVVSSQAWTEALPRSSSIDNRFPSCKMTNVFLSTVSKRDFAYISVLHFNTPSNHTVISLYILNVK